MSRAAVYWTAFRTILTKEVLRFARIWVQTVLPPAITINNVLPGYTDTERLRSLAPATWRIGLMTFAMIPDRSTP